MNEMDELLQRLYRNSDEDLLREFKAAEAEVEAEGGPRPDPEGFERLWKKMVSEFHKDRPAGDPGLSLFFVRPIFAGPG